MKQQHPDIELYQPLLEDYWYEQKILSDPETMSYNAGYEINSADYDYDTGTIRFPREKWQAQYDKRQLEKFYFAYIQDAHSHRYYGTVNLNVLNDGISADCGVVVEAAYRGRGLGRIALKLLIEKAREMNIRFVIDSFEKDRGHVPEMFINCGFIIDRETTWLKNGMPVTGLVVRYDTALEYLDVVSENDELTGVIMDKERVHRLGRYHRTAHIWLVNGSDELLLQKRSIHKSSFPGYWDISAAGHIRAGESVRQGAIRELQEELGVAVRQDDLIPVTIVSYFSEHNREFGYVFLLETELKENEFRFTDGEVDEVRFVHCRKLKRMIADHQPDILVHGDEENILFDFLRRRNVRDASVIK